MSSQRYTRWRTTDEEYDEEAEENGELTEPRDQEENESRRAFTLMTPSRESAGAYPNIFSRKVILVVILLCVFCLFGGAFIGFYVGWTPKPESSTSNYSWHQDTTVAPEVKPSPAPSTLCDHPDAFEDIPAMSIKLMNNLSIYDIRKHIRYLSKAKPTDISTYIMTTLRKHGYTVKSLVYSVSTSYHNRSHPSTVSVLYNNGTTFEISSSFRTDSENNSFVSFNGYSANGTFSGAVIYGHFATEKDLEMVQASNITLNNSILLIRQGKIHPAIQVRNAEKFGVKAVVLYPDPDDFGGNMNTTNPKVTSLPEDGVITQSLRITNGDPATVGYSSIKSVYRLPSSNFSDIPSIPVQSISAAEARLIFSLLQGPTAPDSWKGAVSVENTIGGGFKPEFNITSLNISVFSDIGYSDVKSIHAYLPSEDDTKLIHVGTHFDESTDRIPTSVVSVAAWLSFAEALKGAFPNGTRRKVMFSAFPGTEGDYSGGGEYAELFSNWIHTTSMAYVDFDDILKGSGFIAARASPLMRKVVKDAYHHVEWPNKYNTSVYHGLLDVKKKFDNDSSLQFPDLHEIKEASVCGESANFYVTHGIPTVNLAAVDIKQNHFYMKNSQYDELEVGIKTMDPDLEWTHMITSLLSVCSIILSNAPVPPVEFENYANYLKNEWALLRYQENPIIKEYNEIIDAISGELDILATLFESLDKWYMDDSTTPLLKSRKREQSLLQFIMISRHFIRPSSVPSPLKGGSLITFGPQAENSCEGVSYPMIRKVLYDIKQNTSTRNDFERELSIILSAVSSLNTKFGWHR